MSGILLATHGGESGEGAARVASGLARRLGIPLHAIAVFQAAGFIDDGFGAAYMLTAAEVEDTEAALAGAVTEQLGRCGVHDCTPQIRIGMTTSEIATAARTLGADLIVVGLGSHHVIDRALGDETALYLAQVAATPVLAVPASATSIPHRAVAAIDFSPTSILAARTVARWLEPDDALHLAHVVAGESSARHGRTAGSVGDESAAVRLAEVASWLGGGSDKKIDTVQLTGEPARALLEYAREIDADVIVLGSHGYGIWKRLMLGSVASKIIRLSPRAVLVAPIGCLSSLAAGSLRMHADASAARARR